MDCYVAVRLSMMMGGELSVLRDLVVRFWIPAFAGMTGGGVCGIKPLCLYLT